jgi:multiple sugar transport system substrate-binding protein
VAQRVRDIAQGAKIELRLLAPEGATGNLRPVLSAFAAQTGVTVQVTERSVDGVIEDLLLSEMSKADSYDLALPATFGIPDLVDAKAISPITDFAKRHEPEGFRDDILFGIGDKFDGETYGFQTDGDAYVMFYNKLMLQSPEEQKRYADTYGSPLDIPKTWVELDRQMAFFNRPDDGMWGGLLFRTSGYLAWEWWVRFHAKGVWPLSPDMEPQIASDAGIEALEEMIRATEHLCPDVHHLGLFENWERYSRADVYCNIGWGGSQKYLNGHRSQMRGNTAYGTTPGGMVDGKLLTTPYFNWGWDYVVTRNSLQPEISYLFSLFASTPEMSTLAVSQADGFFDPYRPEHYDDIGIQAAYGREFLQVQRESLESAIPDLYLQHQGEYFRVLNDWLSRAVSKDVSAEAALTRVAESWRLITHSAGHEKQRARWQQLRAKYPEEIRHRLRDTS